MIKINIFSSPRPWLAAGIFLLAVIYYPGLSGPFLFDDHANITDNSYLRINSLDLNTLTEAAFSGEAGPLRRPLAVGSFALNYYYAQGHNPFYLKLTNLLIHSINFVFVYIFVFLLYNSTKDSHQTTLTSNPHWFALAVALIWASHPINLTSVLYVVQRMTSLAALFSWLSLIFYLQMRLAHQSQKTIIYLLLSIISMTFAAFSKENALLIPLYILAIDTTVFHQHWPWKIVTRWARTHRILCLFFLAIAATLGIYIINEYLIGGYQARPFTLTERLLTESRVIFHYLSLISLPRISDFALFHDEIEISTSLFKPLTTLLSIIGHAVLLVAAIALRQMLPLVTIGIAIFYSGHLMESTFIPLEIAHEHRNYLPSLGILLAACSAIEQLFKRLTFTKYLYITIYGALIIFAITTAFRAYQWGDGYRLASYEALHHPDSANSQMLLSRHALLEGDYQTAYFALKRAHNIKPKETGYLFNLAVLSESLNIPIEKEQNEELIDLLRTAKLSATTKYIMTGISSCILDKCNHLQEQYESWIRAALENQTNTVDRSLLYYNLGITLIGQEHYSDALNALNKASKLDPDFLHPLIVMVDLLLKLKEPQHAEMVLGWLRENNSNSRYQRDKEIAQLNKRLEVLKKIH